MTSNVPVFELNLVNSRNRVAMNSIVPARFWRSQTVEQMQPCFQAWQTFPYESCEVRPMLKNAIFKYNITQDAI